jgi:hypothetical protein
MDSGFHRNDEALRPRRTYNPSFWRTPESIFTFRAFTQFFNPP